MSKARKLCLRCWTITSIELYRSICFFLLAFQGLHSEEMFQDFAIVYLPNSLV